MGTTLEKTNKNILAFGDSLTKGFYCGGIKYHPYSVKLEALIKSEGLNYKITTSGLNGETTDKMITRLPELLEEKYNIVLILAGTNDLGFRSYDKIADNIKTLHSNAVSKGLDKTVMITIPGNECDDLYDFYKERRENTNDSLRKFIKEGELESTILCDLDKEMSYSKMSKKEKKEFYDDHLHFSPAGYDKIAVIIYKTLKDNNILI